MTPKNRNNEEIKDLPNANVDPSEAAKVKGGLCMNEVIAGVRRRGITGDWNSDGDVTVA